MADLTELQAAQQIKLIGQDATALETNPVGADSNLQLLMKDVVNSSLVAAALSVTTTAAEAKVGASRLTNRKLLEITPTNGTIYYGDASVTTTSGTPILKNQTKTLSIGVGVFLIAASTMNVRITEGN